MGEECSLSSLCVPFSVVFSQFSLSLSVPSVWGFTRDRSGVFIWGLSPHRRAAKLKITLKLAVAPSPLNTLLKNVPVLSEASWNKPVDRVLLGVSYAWWF